MKNLLPIFFFFLKLCDLDYLLRTNYDTTMVNKPFQANVQFYTP